ncbi:MAG: rhomboid family intramembrane serine protease [Cyclobacteriaceae bacterium]
MFNQRLTPIVKNIIFLNVGFFILQMLTANSIFNIKYYLSLYNFHSDRFLPFQYITYMFLHADFMHLLFNMLPIYFFGAHLEELLGERKFILFYLVCGIGAGILYSFVHNYEINTLIESKSLLFESYEHLVANRKYLQDIPMLGASGAVFGVLMASALYFPNATLVLFPIPIPIKMKYFVMIYAVIELYSGVYRAKGDNVAHFAHLGGMVFAYLLVTYWRKRGDITY